MMREEGQVFNPWVTIEIRASLRPMVGRRGNGRFRGFTDDPKGMPSLRSPTPRAPTVRLRRLRLRDRPRRTAGA